MSTVRRNVLPTLLVLLVVAELVTALIGSAGIRADQRKAAAIRAEKRAVAAYKHRLEPFALQVFDVVQPLQDTDDAFAKVTPGQFGARDDVLAHSGAVGQLSAIHKGVAALAVPKSFHARGIDVLSGIDGLTAAARNLAAATTAKGDRTGYVAAFGASFEQLDSAEGLWLSAMLRVYGTGHTPPTPSVQRSAAQGRTTPTKGGFLQRADLICGQGEVDVASTGDVKGLQDVLRVFPKQAVILRRVAAMLAAVRSDAASAPFLHQLHLQLTAHDAFPAALLALVNAAKRSDSAAYDRAVTQLEAATLTLRDLSRSFMKYGATVCSEYFNVDDLLTQEGGKGTLST